MQENEFSNKLYTSNKRSFSFRNEISVEVSWLIWFSACNENKYYLCLELFRSLTIICRIREADRNMFKNIFYVRLLVQNQQWKRQNTMWTMWDVNVNLWCFYRQLRTDFTHCSGFSIVDFEQVNSGLDDGCQQSTGRGSRSGRLLKKVLLEILQNSQENTCARASFSIKLQTEACNFIKNDTLTQVFSCEFAEISKNTFS